MPDVRYEIVIYWSGEDETFVAEVSALPGCMSDGATYAEAAANAEDAARAWVATALALSRDIPAPRRSTHA